MVKTDVAFHSPMLLDLVEPLQEVFRGKLNPKKPHTKLYTTAELDSSQQRTRNADYWIRNMVNPAHLTSTIQKAISDEYRVFLEVSAHPIVSQSIDETIMELASKTTLKTATPQKDIPNSIAQLHCKGVLVDWKKLNPFSWAVDIPTTPWLHKTIVRKITIGPLNASTTHDVHKHTLLGQRKDVAGINIVVYSTRLDDSTKPFLGKHPRHGVEIVPAAALINTFYHATKASEINNVILRVPVAISAPRDVQIVMEQDQVKITSRLVQGDDSSAYQDRSWVTHTTAQFNAIAATNRPNQLIVQLDLPAIRARINTRLRDDFSIDYLDQVGVSAMGFPWSIAEHWGNTREMLARVDVAPSVAESRSLPWDQTSWAPILDAATSVDSTLFFNEPNLRMPAVIERVNIYASNPPPKIAWLYVEEDTNAALVSHVTVTDESGVPLAKFTSMRFSEIEGTPGISGSVESLVHHMSWPPSQLSEQPIDLQAIVLVSADVEIVAKHATALPRGLSYKIFSTASEMAADSTLVLDNHVAIVFLPGHVASLEKVPSASEASIDQLLQLVKHAASVSSPPKIFVITDSVAEAASHTSLAQAPLHGIGRIIYSEQPDIWGGLFDIEDGSLPLTFMKYVKDADIVRIQKGIPRTARLRPMPRDKLLPTARAESNLVPKPEGTYLITGGLGCLGLEVADFLAEEGARRVVLVSRRAIPPRQQWESVPEDSSLALAISKIRILEARGASIYSVAVDIATEGATGQLSQALDNLSLPPVLGVVHAAGVLEDELILASTTPYSRVLAPEIRGALALHAMYPPRKHSADDAPALDFFILFSSCGQLFGFPGQGSYASGNAFLDTLAKQRRSAGDTGCIAFQWTSWRVLGMSTSTNLINAELESRGITDVSRADAFRAWLYAARFDTDHAVVLRALTVAADEEVACPIPADIAPRLPPSVSADERAVGPAGTGVGTDMPTNGPELRAYLEEHIKECVAAVLQLAVDDVDPRTALSDLGIDSVMTVALRAKLQTALKIKVPPTITWNQPTVGHLVGWYAGKIGEKK